MDCCCQQLSLTLRLWVAVPAAAVCSAGLIPHAIFHEYIPLIRNQNLFQLCLFLSSSALSPSIHQPPTKTYYSLFLQTNTVWKCSCFSFHACEQTSESLHCFHTPSSCLPTELFWDVSRDNPELRSSVPENVRSWLYYEHLPKIGHQRLLHPPNAASSGRRCALYCQNIKKKNIPLCRHRHKAQLKSSLLKKKKKRGVVLYGCGRIHTRDCFQHNSISEGSHLSMSLPRRALLAEMLLRTSPVVAWFFSLKGDRKQGERETWCEFLCFTHRIAPVGEQRLINGVWVWDNGPLTKIRIGCNGVNPGCSCLSGIVSVTWFSLKLEHSHACLVLLGRRETLCGPSSLGQSWNSSLLQGCIACLRLAGGHVAFLNLEESKKSPAKSPGDTVSYWKGTWAQACFGDTLISHTSF